MTFLLGLIVLMAPAGDGWSTLKAGDEEVRVYRDSWGIPHVFAKSTRAAFWAQGYLECEDRFAQMDLFRRASRGQASELRGREAAANDRDRLRRGYTEEELRAMFEAGGDRFRSALTAYAEGVNAWLKSGAAPGGAPRPWTETDTVAIGVAMARRFGEAGDTELTAARVLSELTKKVGAEEARKIMGDLLREKDAAAPSTMNDHLRVKRDARKGCAPGPIPSDEAYARYRAEVEETLASRAALGMPVYFGSNAWAVMPRKSASGHALLYGGPMMGFATPSICSEVHLEAEGLRVAGMTFPGAPGVMIGWNDRVAWTTTSGVADLVDIYTLDLNPDHPDEYRYQGAWKKFEVLERELRVRDGDVEKVRVLRSVYGPLAGEPDLKAHRAYTMRMAFWKREQQTFEAVLDLNFAGSLADVEAGLRKIVTSHNFFCATADGHLGFWYCGAHPIRKAGHDPRFPQDGGGAMEWDGFLPFEKWPKKIDPDCGYFANWNNKPTAEWPYAGFGQIFWGKKIIDVLEAEETFTVERFGQIARLTAYHAYLADYFVPIIREAAKGSDDPDVKKGLEILEAWDHQSAEGDRGTLLLEKWVRTMMARTFGGVVDPTLLVSKEVQRFLVDPLLYLLMGDRSLVSLQVDYARGRDLQGLVRDALRDAVKGGEEPPSWKEPLIDFGGDVGKVKSMRGRGTFQMVVEMAPEGPKAITLGAPGQSERPGTPHYKDQMELFATWGYKPFLWRREDMK